MKQSKTEKGGKMRAHLCKEKQGFLVVVIIAAIVMLIINILTPYLADDFGTLRHLFYKDRSREILSLTDAMESSFQYYMTWGGRYFAHLLFTGLGFLPPLAVDVLNTLAYLVSTWLMYEIIRGKREHNLIIFLFIHLLLWICVPDYGQIMFWMCGAANYLYMSIPVLYVIFLFRKHAQGEGEAERSWKWVALMPVGFIAGAAMEQISAGMMIILTLYLIFYRLYSIRWTPYIIITYVSSFIGFCAGVFAPGNFVRTELEKAYPFLVKLGADGYYLVSFLWIPTMLFIIGILYTRKERRRLGTEAGLYMISAFLSAVCLVFTPSVPERGFYIACVFAIIAAGIAFFDCLEQIQANRRPALKIVSICLSLFVLAQAGDTMLASYDITKQTKEREAYILAEKEKGNLDVKVPVIVSNYPLKAEHDGLTGLSDISIDPKFWVNGQVAEYYGIRSITGILQEKK